jgi:hypothetical protein
VPLFAHRDPGRNATPAQVRLLAACLLFAATLAATAAVSATAVARLITNNDGAGGDFLSLYAAGRVINAGLGEDLYDLDLQRMTQQWLRPSFAEEGEYNPYVLPPAVAAAVAPIARLDFKVAFAVWAGLNLAMLAAVASLLWRAADSLRVPLRVALVAAFVCSIPVVANAVFGQVDLFVIAAILLSNRLLRDGQPIATGAALALGVVKPHLLLGVLLLLLVRGQWRALASFATVATPLVLLPALITGPDALVDYGRVLASFPGSATADAVNVNTMPNVRGLIAGATGSTSAMLWLPAHSLVAAFAAGAALFTWQRDEPGGERRSWAVAALFPLLVSPHLHTQSLMLLFVAATFWLSADADRRGAANPRASAPASGRWGLDVLTALLILDVLLFVLWLGAALGVALGFFLVAGAYAACLLRWPDRRREPEVMVRLAA